MRVHFCAVLPGFQNSGNLGHPILGDTLIDVVVVGEEFASIQFSRLTNVAAFGYQTRAHFSFIIGL
jgi:hypothetical protein